ncbi:hypothetical protein [Escherichia albertii]|uniref:hypothetical protein n=1 Tax=Escherichia albertii TaxID=208962 RepID=UPI001FC90505|nr:hypothetical protein [Escherichia albertii]
MSWSLSTRPDAELVNTMLDNAVETVGVQERFLPLTRQVGRGFYIAKMNGTLPQWGAENATELACRNQPYFTCMASLLTGESNNPWLDKAAQRTILKIYTVRPLLRCKLRFPTKSTSH